MRVNKMESEESWRGATSSSYDITQAMNVRVIILTVLR